MNRSLTLYRFLGHRTVKGWLHPEVLTILSVLDSVQRSSNISGAIAEIGVHHGRLFVGLNLLRRDGEHSVAIDVFDDQQYNVDNSGKGDLDRFRRNIVRWSSLDGVEISQTDSTQLESSHLLELANDRVRFFSIDGGHTQSIVLSDMKLAQSTLSTGGVVIADDVFNQFWPGVATGTMDYLHQGGSLVPFAVGFNKVFFSEKEYAANYQAALQRHFENRVTFYAKSSEFAGHAVVVIARVSPTPRRFLRRSETARELYRRYKDK